MRRTTSLTLAMLISMASVPQSTGGYFELVLPDLNKTIGSGNVVADIPAGQLSRITIQLLGSADKNLDYGDVHVRINGRSLSNIFDSGANDRGKFLAMDQSTSARRRDALLDPNENAIEVYGKDRRGRGYYQNWILRSGANDTNPFFTYVSAVSPGDEQGLPPDVVLEQPARPVTFPSAVASVKVRVKGTASAASSIASLSVGGKSIPANGANPVFAFDQTVSVPRGENALTIEAVDSKSNRRSISVPVLYSTTTPPKIVASGDKYALIIGVSRFTAPGDAPPPITAASADARALATALQTRGFRPGNVRLLTDEQATVEQIRTAFGDFTNRAKPEDLLVIFVCTHGLHDPSAPEKIYLAGSNTQRHALVSTALDLTELQLLLNKSLRCRHTLMFFDAEHHLTDDWNFPGRSVVNANLLTLFDGPSQPAVLVAGAPGQDSQAGASDRGLFASAIAEALQGKADINNDHVLTPREICAYVTQSVRKSTGGQQSPEYRIATEENDAALLALR